MSRLKVGTPEEPKQPTHTQAMSAANFSTAALIQSVFGEALSKYTSSLLCKVCLDYELDFKELSEKYMDSADGMSFFTTSQTHEILKTPIQTEKRAKVARVPKEDKKPCVGQTSKGGPCKFAAMSGSDMCGIHQRKTEGLKPEKKPKEAKEPKQPKKKSQDAKHNHELTEEAVEDCELCQSHGNVMNTGLTDAKFEASVDGGVSIQDRLNAILSDEDEAPEKNEEAPEKAEEAPEKIEEVPEKTEEAPEKIEEVPEKIEEAPAHVFKKPEEKTSGFIRPRVRGKRPVVVPEPKPVESVAGPSKPDKKDDDTDNIRSKLRMILAQANEDSDDEEEAFDEEEVRTRLTQKLSSGFDMNHKGESDEDEMDIDQMCDTPDSQGMLRDAWAALKIDDEE